MIVRDPSAAASSRHDLIVIGGGIYGVCTALEAVKRGLRPLLLEKGDFGGATSWNSLRIVHGGLRYLQSLDLRRHFESVRERRWFLRTFPDLVRPLPCLMPLYSNGSALKRSAVLRAALRVNDLLSCTRNNGVRRDRRLADGRILSAIDARLRFPLVRRDGLCAAALWHDAVMLSPQRIIMEILHAACGAGAAALNYVEAASLLTHRGAVEGVAARDCVTGETFEFRAPIVINAAGPWSGLLAQQFDPTSSPHHAALFHPSLAYNLLLARPPVSECAVAVSSGSPGSRVYFLSPARGGVLAGTDHAPVCDWDGSSPRAVPTTEQVQYTLDELNAAVPGWRLSQRDVLRIYSGLLPAKKPGTDTLACRPAIHEHRTSGGPRGLYSVTGVKFTTARLVAERIISRLPAVSQTSPARSPGIAIPELPAIPGLSSATGIDLISPQALLEGGDVIAAHALAQLIAEESVITTDDLLLRRTNWLDDPRSEREVRDRVAELLPSRPDESSKRTAVSAPRLMEARREGAMLPARSPR